jgi:hypothetical protein
MDEQMGRLDSILEVDAMRHFTILLVKFISCIVAFAIGLDLFFNATIVDIVTFSLTVTIISFMIGDRMVLPHFGNTSATMVDFIISYVSVWIFGTILLNNYMQLAWGSIISATIISFAEVFVHHYLLSHSPTVREEARKTYNPRLAFGTEFAKENDMYENKDKHE